MHAVLMFDKTEDAEKAIDMLDDVEPFGTQRSRTVLIEHVSSVTGLKSEQVQVTKDGEEFEVGEPGDGVEIVDVFEGES
jgi:predicted RNA-binding protein